MVVSDNVNSIHSLGAKWLLGVLVWSSCWVSWCGVVAGCLEVE